MKRVQAPVAEGAPGWTNTPVSLGRRGKVPPLEMDSIVMNSPYDEKPKPKGSRALGLEEAPTYRPTKEEFQEPLKYIQSIAEEGKKYGICKIIPPEGWRPTFAVDTERFFFKSRKQELNSMEAKSRTTTNYLDQLYKFHKQHGTQLKSLPLIDKRPLDLYQLKKEVETRGGYNYVCDKKKWAEVGRALGYTGKIMTSLSTSLKASYQKYILPYEVYLVRAKPSVMRQREAENGMRSPAGGMKTPQASPPGTGKTGLNATPMKTEDVTMTDADTFSRKRPAEEVPSVAEVEARIKAGNPEILKEVAAQEKALEERHAKRAKIDVVPAVTGGSVAPHAPVTPSKLPNEANMAKPGENCEACGRGDHAPSILLCDGCDSGYHMGCLDPPLKSIPKNEWYCPKCLVGTGEFGFEDGGEYSLAEFQTKADDYKIKHFAKRLPLDPVTGQRIEITENMVEREFWRLIENPEVSVEVEYGADVHVTAHGSAFPTVERQPTDPYSTDPWNLNVMPLANDSLFRHIKSDVSGMTVPWIYVGMCFSTFCWHSEDHWTYSINYQHFGETKTWYGIPGEDADKFEAAMKKSVPDLFEQQPDLLFQLVTMMSPEKLRKEGVRVYAIDQRANQFVVTFPNAYHAGFNHGFNFNEAVNFAPSDWEPWGRACAKRYQEYRRMPVFSHDEMLMTAAAMDTSVETAQWLSKALEAMVKDETARRDLLRVQVPGLKEKVDEIELADDANYQCGVCKVYTFLAQVTCGQGCTSKVVCTSHVSELCDCEVNTRVYRLRYSDKYLEDLVYAVDYRANASRIWDGKLKTLLSNTAKPSLKELKALLSEGQKIPGDLSGLPILKGFVDRATEWVAEASEFLARKPQNRRKSEKVRKLTKAQERKEEEQRKPEYVQRLLSQAESLPFDCPEIGLLREKIVAINAYRVHAIKAIGQAGITKVELEEVIEAGRSVNVDLAETELLERYVAQLNWLDKAAEASKERLTAKQLGELLSESETLEMPENNEHVVHLRTKKDAGERWDEAVKQLLAMDNIPMAQLMALSEQAGQLPVDQEIFQKVEGIIARTRDTHRIILDLLERSRNPDPNQRPNSAEVDVVKKDLEDLNVKTPEATLLEKEAHRVDDWIRKGKRLFGKANAPLEILGTHLSFVEKVNDNCFSLDDKPRSPVEPSSREASPEAETINETGPERAKEGKDVFCLCRTPESGLMIECGVCHEWYHGRCLKMNRKKLKDEDTYTCPVCDYRVTIPRQSDRPRLDDLHQLAADALYLPFMPKELSTLRRIVDTAQKFRNVVTTFLHTTLCLTAAELPIIKFYLRKIEGAEVLLDNETNYFRAKVHEWMPIADEAPEAIGESKSTRKPRLSKKAKMMMEAQANGTMPVEMTPTATPQAKPPPAKAETPMNPPYLQQHSVSHSPSPYASTPMHTIQICNKCAHGWAPHEQTQMLVCQVCNGPFHPHCANAPSSMVGKPYICEGCCGKLGQPYAYATTPPAATPPYGQEHGSYQYGGADAQANGHTSNILAAIASQGMPNEFLNAFKDGAQQAPESAREQLDELTGYSHGAGPDAAHGLSTEDIANEFLSV
ncbi:PLU-1-domain-containing protein [Saitoella complicata NRRL Y-17804]|nr:PLU-1-domain-containing protein [Saitoella complicata NRRL Y-17804]ODQ54061.1 PLU-1-domain-containing protein [Saitoella complicata NRRL Y-17804]